MNRRTSYDKYIQWMRSLCILLVMSPWVLVGQGVYKMGNDRVYNCRGKLTDSEGNQQSAKKYANNESYVFTVCVKGASSIDFTFKSAFCTESGADYLKVFKGSDTFGTLLNTFTGTINNPAPFSVNDSCVTFFFHSDQNIVCDGWDIDWEAHITSVPKPVFSPIADPKCNTSNIRVTLDQKFNCDSVKASNFALTGPMSAAVISAKGVNCDSRNETNTFDITFAAGLDRSGNYSLNFNSSFRDACDSVWSIRAKLDFRITDCPIRVQLSSGKYVLCKGSCATLTAAVSGGNPSNYVYTWLSGGLAGVPPKTICPLSDTRYILQVTDGVSVAGADTVDITVLDPPVVQNDTTVCQSSGSFDLKAVPPGGSWTGPGITNAANGTFSPGLAKGGIHKIFYTAGGCRDSMRITVVPIFAGNPLAACPGSAPFQVTGFSPAGGTWSGPNITAGGLITPPSVSGSFTVTYSWNGCTGNRTIHVDSISIPQADTICKSKPVDTLTFYPAGGIWSGPGMTNTFLGINTPPAAGAGNKRYIYTINGCRDTLNRVILEVDALYDEIACPDAGLKTLPAALPPGGYWKGKGIYDAVAGIFNPDSFSVPGKSVFTQTVLTYYADNGCKDNKIIYLRYTRFYKDTVRNCVRDTAYFMRYQYVQSDPWNMFFSGSGAITGSQVYYQKFNPSKAGRGSWHQVIGEANGCRDTLVIHVYPRARIQNDTVFCIADDPVNLYNAEGAGLFSGKGITNGIAGTFNPKAADTGTHKIYFSLPGKCIDTITITVKGLPQVSIGGLNSMYCMKDTLVNLQLNPPGGILSGNGISGNTFNPWFAGTGQHLLQYTYGTGKCVSQSRKTVTISDTLALDLYADKDTVCHGTTVTLSTKSYGGTGRYDLRWNSGEFNVESVFKSPKNTTSYTVVLKDGCSDSVVKSQAVYVHQPFYGTIQTSPIQCYGNLGFANVTVNGAGPYSYFWNTIPPQTTPQITAPVGTSYKLKVTNTMTGCVYDTTATIPGYSRIRAFFTTSPAGQCVYTGNARIRIINLSEGGTAGVWDFGDNKVLAYDPLDNPSHIYPDDSAGNYTIRLSIENEGKCTDTFSVDICVLDTIALFVPNAFTPNDDASNDEFRIESPSVTETVMEIYNRWGEKMFMSEDPGKGWNGTFKGKPCPADYYVYVIRYKGKKTPWRYTQGYFYLLR